MNTPKQIWMLAMLGWVLTAGCKKETESTGSVEAQTYMNVSYGNHPAQQLDVYLPSNLSNATPVIVMLHGGGFIAGDKSEFSERAAALSARGYTVLNVNYRLVDSTGALTIPIEHKPSDITIAHQLQDIDAAVTFALGKAPEWNMSATHWSITGHSAGATLALLYSYGDKNSNRIKVAGNWAGATNFAFTDESEADSLDPRIKEIIYRAVGAEMTNANKLAYMAVSPYWVANARGAIPTLNIRPEHNGTSGTDQSKAEYQKFTELLNSKSVPNKWVKVPAADHGFSQLGNWDTVVEETDRFFKGYLR